MLRVLGTFAHVLVAHPQGLNDAHASDQYDPVLELQKIQHALGSLSEAEVQVGQQGQEGSYIGDALGSGVLLRCRTDFRLHQVWCSCP